jgi:FkbM family methyltransferase
VSISELLRRAHPLHRLRRSPLFQAISRRFDPIIPWKLSVFPRPLYLRPLAHGALMAGAMGQEQSTHETFLAILRALPDESGGFWDVGANIGWFSWLCAATRPDLEIVSFEPDRKNLACLRRTSRRWGLPCHTVVPCAVAEESGRAAFFVDPLSGATGALESSGKTFNAQHYKVDADRTEVETISLDDFLEADGKAPALVKIDVEGAELRVLEGGRALLDRHCPILLFESFEHGKEIVGRLQEHGYRSFDSDRRGAVTPETLNFVALAPDRWPRVADALRDSGYPL